MVVLFKNELAIDKYLRMEVLIYMEKIVTMLGMVANPSVFQPFALNINSWFNLTLGQLSKAKNAFR